MIYVYILCILYSYVWTVLSNPIFEQRRWPRDSDFSFAVTELNWVPIWDQWSIWLQLIGGWGQLSPTPTLCLPPLRSDLSSPRATFYFILLLLSFLLYYTYKGPVTAHFSIILFAFFANPPLPPLQEKLKWCHYFAGRIWHVCCCVSPKGKKLISCKYMRSWTL